MTRLIACKYLGCLMMLGAGAAFGQSYPNKPIRIFAPEPGGSADFAARVIAQGLTGSLGQTVIVENRGGASGAIAAEIVAKSPPDGQVLMIYSNTFWTLPFIHTVSYDPVKDFSPIVLATRAPAILIVHPSLPVKSVKELIALARARPGALNYGTGGLGSTPHLAAELFKSMARVDIVRINYKGGGAALNDLIAGNLQMMFATTISALPHVKSGRLKALAVTSLQPSELVPGLPTMAASGLPGYESTSKYGAWAPAGTPAAVVNRLNQEIVRVLNTPDVRKTFLNVGAEVVGSSPELLAATMKSELAQMGNMSWAK